MDGRKSFIFSWNQKHREIHEEALRHFFDSRKKGQKFEYQPKRSLHPKPSAPPLIAPEKGQPLRIHRPLPERTSFKDPIVIPDSNEAGGSWFHGPSYHVPRLKEIPPTFDSWGKLFMMVRRNSTLFLLFLFLLYVRFV